jgi:hypothetical protein
MGKSTKTSFQQLRYYFPLSNALDKNSSPLAIYAERDALTIPPARPPRAPGFFGAPWGPRAIHSLATASSTAVTVAGSTAVTVAGSTAVVSAGDCGGAKIGDGGGESMTGWRAEPRRGRRRRRRGGNQWQRS